jgi:hypothetical protein
LLGLDGTTSLTLTVTNPNSDAWLTGIASSSTLPSGIVVVGPNGVGDTCAGTVTAPVGNQSIALAGGSVPPGGSCAVSEELTATSTGRFQIAAGPVTSIEGGSGNAASATLTVIGAPVVSLSSPEGGARYAFGEKVRATYSCADDPNGPGVSACIGPVASGSPIATRRAGPQSFSGVAISRDGGVASETAFYTVAPNNRFRVRRRHIQRNGTIDFAIGLPERGRIDVLETARSGRARLVFARRQALARRAGTVHVTIHQNGRGRRAMHDHGALAVSVVVGYTPTGGTRRTARFVFAA